MRVRHSNGTVIASDGRILVQREEDYLCGTDDRLYAESDKGSALLTALVPREGTHMPCGIYSYKQAGETARSGIGQQAKPSRLNAAGKGGIDAIDQIAEKRSREQDSQGNPLNADGSLKVEAVSSIDELTDEDFTKPTRNVQLPELPGNVATAIGTDGKPVVIKKNILKRNTEHHPDVSPSQSREILKAALYAPDLYGQNQRASRPYNWMLISVKGEDGRNKLVLLEANHNKDFDEIVHWHFVEDRAIAKIKKQAEREGGQLLMLPSVDTEEAGALSGRPSGSASEGKDSKKDSATQQKQSAENENTPKQPAPTNANAATAKKGKTASQVKQEQQTSPYVPKKGSPARQFLDAYERLEEAKRKYSEIKERMAEIKGLTLLPSNRDDDDDRASKKGRYNGNVYALTKLARALKDTEPEISARIETELAKHKKDEDSSGIITWINDLKRTSETVRDTIGTIEEGFEKEFKKEYDKLSGELRSASAEESNAMAALYATMDQIRTDCKEGRASFGEILQFIQVSATGLDFFLDKDLRDSYEVAPEPFAKGNSKHKFNIYSFCAGKEAESPALMGVHYSNGTVTASNGHILVQKKEDYPAEKEGKSIGKDGAAIESKYPDVQGVSPKDVSGLPSVYFDATDLERWCSAVIEQAKQARQRAQTKIPAKYDGSTTVIKVGDQYAWYDTEQLYQFAQAAVEIGATKLYLYRNYGHDILYTESDMGRVMLMPYRGMADFGALGVYSYKRAGETARSGIGQQAKRERPNDTRYSIGEPYDVKENPVGRAEPGLNSKSVAVVSVPRHNFKGTGKEALQAAGSWATDNLVGEYSNEETGGKGVMYVSGNAISKFLSKAAVHKSNSLGVHLAVLKKFKDVLRESTDCESHPDYKKGKDGERRPENGIASKNIIHRLYGAVVIDGKMYRVKTTVKEQTETGKRNAPYTYEVTEIELLDGSMAGIVNDGSQLLSDAPSNSISLAKLLKNVRMSYAEAGKDASEAEFLLDESRKRDEKEAEQTTVAETTKTVAAELQDKFGTEAEVIEGLDGMRKERLSQAREHHPSV